MGRLTREAVAKAQVGEELRRARVSFGLSLRQVADAAGLRHVRFSEIERGAMLPATPAELDAIERAIEKGADLPPSGRQGGEQ